MGEKKRNARVCPKCGAADSRVKDTRLNKDTGILERRRECSACGARWKTVEIEYKAFAAIVRKGRSR